MTATTGPTLLEKLHALEVTARRLAAERADLAKTNRQLVAERDVAMQMAAQATKDQDRERRELLARLKVRDVQIDSLRIEIDGKNADIRQLTARVRELALTCEDQQRQLDRAQQEPQPARTSWWSRRIGNQL